jgi:hypothetical protein
LTDEVPDDETQAAGVDENVLNVPVPYNLPPTKYEKGGIPWSSPFADPAVVWSFKVVNLSLSS